jgi:hypothetical protein
MKWVMVTQLVEAHRMQQWQEEQDRLGKEALNEAIEKSRGLLDRRRTRDGSTRGSDDESDDSEASDSEKSNPNSDIESEHESNMSSTQSENEEDQVIGDDDEGLTQEELRIKYASVPNMEGKSAKSLDGMELDISGPDSGVKILSPMLFQKRIYVETDDGPNRQGNPAPRNPLSLGPRSPMSVTERGNPQEVQTADAQGNLLSFVPLDEDFPNVVEMIWAN